MVVVKTLFHPFKIIPVQSNKYSHILIPEVTYMDIGNKTVILHVAYLSGSVIRHVKDHMVKYPQYQN